LGALPTLIGALIILVIGFIVAKVLQGITTRVLRGLGFEGWMEQGGVKQILERSQTRQTPLSILGKLVFWLVFFVAISMAVDNHGSERHRRCWVTVPGAPVDDPPGNASRRASWKGHPG